MGLRRQTTLVGSTDATRKQIKTLFNLKKTIGMTDQCEGRCLNCQAKLEGPFCGQCGQARSARLVPVKDWFSDFSEAFLSLDSKLLRTVKCILFRPGEATHNFAMGRRISFSGPLQIYIIASAVSIAVMTMHGVFSQAEDAALPGMPVDGDYQERVQFLFPFINLLSPFLTAGVLAITQPQRYFQLHLAFSLHLWTFMVVVATPLVFIPPTSIWILISFAVLMLVLAGYLFLAHRRVYTMPLVQRLVICGFVALSALLAIVLFSILVFVVASVT